MVPTAQRTGGTALDGKAPAAQLVGPNAAGGAGVTVVEASGAAFGDAPEARDAAGPVLAGSAAAAGAR